MSQPYIKTTTRCKPIHCGGKLCLCKKCINILKQKEIERLIKVNEAKKIREDRIKNEGVTCFMCKKHLTIDNFHHPFEQNCHCKECGSNNTSTCCNCRKTMTLNSFKTKINGEPYKVCYNCDIYKRW